jgi:hypothetical protein
LLSVSLACQMPNGGAVKRALCSSCLILNLSLISSVAYGQAVAVQQADTVQAPKSVKHLQNATELLSQVASKPAGKDAPDRIADLRRHYAAMVAAYRAEAGGAEAVAAPAPNAAEGRTSENEPSASAWKTIFSDVERDLTKIVGGGSSLGPPTGVVVAPVTPAATSTSASAGVTIPPVIAVVPGGATPVVPTANDVAANPRPVGTAGTRSPAAVEATPQVNPNTATQVEVAGQVATAARGSAQTSPSGATAAPSGTAAAAVAQARAAGVPVAPTEASIAPNTTQTAVAEISEAGLLGFAATKLSPLGIRDLDMSARRQLEAFRVQLELFYTEAQNEAVKKPTKN